MKRRAALAATTSAVLSLALGACAQDPVGPASGGLDLRTAAIGSCGNTENRDRQFPSGSDRVVLELTGDGLESAWTGVAAKGEANAAGEIIIESVPIGTGLTLRVVACDGAATTWAGETHGVDLVAHQKSFPPVFLTPTGVLACTGTAASAPGSGATSEPRAFAAMAADSDSAWVFGGFRAYGVSEGATATQTIDRYTRLTSEFEPAGGLLTHRGMAHAQLLSNGTVRVFGGAKKVRIAQAGKPSIYATAADAPDSASEIYDPATSLSTLEEAVKLPALPSTATVGEIGLAVGGVEAGGVGNQDPYSRNVTRFDAANGASSAELPGPGRFGATVVPLGASMALVWGGNVDGDPVNVGVLVDTTGAVDAAFTELTVTGATSVPIFAAGVVVGSDAAGRVQVAIAGGNVINPGPAFPRDVAAARLDLVSVDVAAGTAAVTAIALGDLAPDFTRAAGTLQALGGGELLWFGGFTAFQNSPICGAGNDCIQTGIVRFGLTGLGATPVAPVAAAALPELELNVGPLGARAVALGDGSWLMTGGIETITQTTLSDAAALVRYGAFSRDLCAEVPLPVP